MVSYGSIRRESADENVPEEGDQIEIRLETKSRDVWQLAIVSFLVFVSFIIITAKYSRPTTSNQYLTPMPMPCAPGVVRTGSQLQFSAWAPAEVPGLKLPLYWTQPLDEPDDTVEHAVIVQHGNLRNANDYFCGAVNSLLSLDLPAYRLQSYVIIAPLFLGDSDVCWDAATGQRGNVQLSNGSSCGYPVWSSEGWKDGHLPLNLGALPLDPAQRPPLFSYEAFNIVLRALS
ncbi:hypothetical protein EON64_09435, partial [archaeon]